MTAVHDRYLGVVPTQRPSLRESYHLSQCRMLYNEWLGQAIKEEHKDPLWATAGALGILTFPSINAGSPKQAWPLVASDASNLAWIHLGARKMDLCNLVNPMRPGGVLCHDRTFAYLHYPLPQKGTDGVSVELVQLCALDESSTQETNSYFSVAHALSRLLLEAPKGPASQGAVILVSRHMDNEFGVLLDSVALLLLFV